MIKLYRPIFFAQGEDATDLLDMISEQGEADTLMFILDHWCSSEEHEKSAWTDESEAGGDDRTFSITNRVNPMTRTSEGYQLSYSFHYNYVGVEETRTIEKE